MLGGPAPPLDALHLAYSDEMRLSFGLAVASLSSFVIAGCREQRQEQTANITGDAGIDAAPVASAAPNASASSSAVAAAEDRAKHFVSEWTRALDRHDVVGLARFYGDPVKMYGHDSPKSTVMQMKARALGPRSTFKQSIAGAVTVTFDGTSYSARFVKRTGSSDRMRDVPSRLLLVVTDGAPDGFSIREESDDVSDVKASAPAASGSSEPSRDACESAASQAVQSLPRVKSLLESDNKELAKQPGGQSVGGIGPMDEEGGGFSAGLGIHWPERYEAQVWYAVDRAGKLTVTVLGEDIAVPSATLAAVEHACKR